MSRAGHIYQKIHNNQETRRRAEVLAENEIGHFVPQHINRALMPWAFIMPVGMGEMIPQQVGGYANKQADHNGNPVLAEVAAPVHIMIAEKTLFKEWGCIVYKAAAYYVVPQETQGKPHWQIEQEDTWPGVGKCSAGIHEHQSFKVWHYAARYQCCN